MIKDAANSITLSTTVGKQINDNQFNELRNLADRAVRRFNSVTGKCKKLATEIINNKTGSKKFRIIMDAINNNKINVKKSRQWRKHVETTDTPQDLSTKQVELLLSNWAGSYFGYRKSMFAFKYYNNTLGINSRVCHYSREIDAGCTFCKESKILPPPKGNNTPHFLLLPLRL
jgi:hypothetical protein